MPPKDQRLLVSTCRTNDSRDKHGLEMVFGARNTLDDGKRNSKILAKIQKVRSRVRVVEAKLLNEIVCYCSN